MAKIMRFEDILSDIQQLIGLKLLSINPTTPSMEIVRCEIDKGSYFIRVEGSKRESSRSIKELMTIWNRLKLQGYVSVDVALNGSGTSRNQPETIFANLPYIQHFKYKKRKHLILRNRDVHPRGELLELSDKETKLVRKQIDNQLDISFQHLNLSQIDAIEHINKSLSIILTKYSGEVELKDVEAAMSKLTNVREMINDATVNVDSEIRNHNTNEENPLRNMKLENLADSPEVTGVYDGQNEDEDEDEDATQETLVEQALTNYEIKKSLITPRIRQLNPTFSLIYDRLRYGELKIPEYQRKTGIWGPKEKAKLIESILLGLPLPIFYFAEKENGDWIIVDGLQRITTMLDFINNHLTLTKLDELSNLNDKTFQDLDRSSQRKIREFQLTSYVIDMEEGNSRFISELFHRINTFGVKLSPQEIRNAVNIGQSVSFLHDLANTDEFLRITNNKINPIRQKDLEVCLSAISFMIYGYEDYNYTRQDDFLSYTMEFLNKTTPNEREKIKESFTDSLLLCEEVFGTEAFLKDLNPKKSSPISKPLFEILIPVFSCISKNQKDKLKSYKEDFVTCLYDAIKYDSKNYASWISETYIESERGFNYSISQSTGKRVTVLYRFESLLSILNISCGIEVKLIRLHNDQ
jgi:hypothetical protein